MRRFSIRSLMAFVVVSAVAIAALRNAEADAKRTHDRGRINTGDVTLTDQAVTKTDTSGKIPNVTVSSCLDISKWQTVDAKTKKRRSLFEPVHGSAPDIAGQGLANPIAMISSFGMALRYSFDMGAHADKVDAAITAVLASGLRTADIKSEGMTDANTSQMGEAILKEMQKLHA